MEAYSFARIFVRYSTVHHLDFAWFSSTEKQVFTFFDRELLFCVMNLLHPVESLFYFFDDFLVFKILVYSARSAILRLISKFVISLMKVEPFMSLKLTLIVRQFQFLPACVFT